MGVETEGVTTALADRGIWRQRVETTDDETLANIYE